jgi:uncharacterized alpha-E superfamily protein
MLSRVAEAIHWMSRYIERAENVARFVDVNLHLALDGTEPVEQWGPLVETTGDVKTFNERYGEQMTRDNVLRFLTFDPDTSILSCFAKARENARGVREIISSEMWEHVNQAYLMVTEAARSGAALDEPHEFYTAVKQASHLFVGITYLTMTHNEAWHFGRLGRLIERADMTSRILDVKYYILLPEPAMVGSPVDELQWAALLKSASAFEMYRKRHGNITPEKVVDFLMLSRRFPRSVRYCTAKAERSLHAITGAASGTWTTLAERELGKLNAELSYASTEEIVMRGVHETIDTLQMRLSAVTGAVFETFFAMRPEGQEPDSEKPPLAPHSRPPFSFGR